MKVKHLRNHRLVSIPSHNEDGDEPWIAVQEVYYEDGKPRAYADPCCGSETLEGAKQVCAWFAEAASKPVLHEDDFKREVSDVAKIRNRLGVRFHTYCSTTKEQQP